MRDARGAVQKVAEGMQRDAAAAVEGWGERLGEEDDGVEELRLAARSGKVGGRMGGFGVGLGAGTPVEAM